MQVAITSARKGITQYITLENVALFSALIIAIGLPLSTSVVSIMGAVLAVCGLLVFRYRLFSNVIGYSILFFVMWYGFRAVDSYGELHEARQYMHKMARLLLIPLVASFMTDAKWRRYIMLGFITAVVFSVIVAMQRGVVLFKDNIITSLFVGFSAYMLLHIAVEQKRWRWLALCMSTFLAYYLLFVGTGRSGQLLFIMLSLLFCWQRFASNRKMRFIGLGALVAVISSCMFFPSSFMQRQHLALQEMRNYSVEHEDAVPHTSSMGMRLVLLHNTWELIKQRPLLGWGTGGYRKAYAEHAPEATFAREQRSNPHNQYLTAWVETGVLGLIGLVVFLGSCLLVFVRMRTTEGYLGVGLVLTYAIGCLANSWLNDCAPAYFFILMSALCLGAVTTKKSKV